MTLSLLMTVKEKSVTGGALNSQAPRAVTDRQVITYDALVTGADGVITLNPEDVIEQDVIHDGSFPIVNESVFGYISKPILPPVICPWMICLNKRAERDQGERLLWRVSAEYGTGNRFHVPESALALIDAPVDITGMPVIQETVWGEEERIIYEEAEPPPKFNKLRLPTGSYYSEPFRRRFPKRTIRQSQFEDLTPATVDEAIESRLFTVQDRTFPLPPAQGDLAADSRWMITAIDYQSVTVPSSTGSTFPAMLMSYVFERNAGDGGWQDKRGLVDKFYLKTAGDLNSKAYFTDFTDGRTVIDALLETDGTARSKADQDAGNLAYIKYNVQPVGDWSFVQTP